MPLRTGIGADTYKEYLIGPGAVYYNWQSNAVPGTLLGETKGGNVFEVIPTFHETEPDGAFGHVEDHTRIASVIIRLTANLLSITSANILKTLAGSESANYNVIHIPAEYLGTALCGAPTTKSLEGSTSIMSDTLHVYQDTSGAPVELALGTDYTWSAKNGDITLLSGHVPTSASITAMYDYNSGTGGTMTIITMDQLVTGDELANIAIVGEISDVDKTLDAVLVVKNALCMNGLTLTLPAESRGETVMTAIFEGHWDTSDLTLSNAPFQIRYDAQ